MSNTTVLCKEYLAIKELEKRQKARKLEIEVELYNINAEKFNSKETGTLSAKRDGFVVKCVKKETETIDQKLAASCGLAFSVKYSLDKKAYKDLDPADQKKVDACITTKPSKPSFSVEAVVEEE